MFKLVKILNGRTNQGEPVRLPVASDATNSLHYSRGCLLTLKNGVLANCGATDKPMYYCIEGRTIAPAASATMWVMPLSDDMVFEAPVTYSDTPNTLAVGGLYTTAQTVYDSTNNLSVASGITDVSVGGTVRVYSLPESDGDKIWVTIPQ